MSAGPLAHGRDLEVRAFAQADTPAVLSLLQTSLGWLPHEDHAGFFAWKHRENPLGASPAWVALDGDRVVGFRTFLRWDFTRDGSWVRAVRAVDTATHPDHQGRGVFSRLTRHALGELAGEGVGFVFNTPNAQSRPGYLKMGWQEMGRVPVRARPSSVRSLPRLLRARVPAERWSLATGAGTPAAEALADEDRVTSLLAGQPAAHGLATRRTPAFLAWRYGFAPLRYRAMLAGERLDYGFALFRLRRRGSAVEAVVADVLVPEGDDRLVASALGRVVARSGADYALRVSTQGRPRSGFVAVPGQGPTLLWRGVRDEAPPALTDWRLCLGDVELF